jgi:hypothetical protein
MKHWRPPLKHAKLHPLRANAASARPHNFIKCASPPIVPFRLIIFSNQTENKKDSQDNQQPDKQIGDKKMIPYLPAGAGTRHQVLPGNPVQQAR